MEKKKKNGCFVPKLVLLHFCHIKQPYVMLKPKPYGNGNYTNSQTLLKFSISIVQMNLMFKCLAVIIYFGLMPHSYDEISKTSVVICSNISLPPVYRWWFQCHTNECCGTFKCSLRKLFLNLMVQPMIRIYLFLFYLCEDSP